MRYNFFLIQAALFSTFLDLCWRRQWHLTPVLLPGKSHGWRSLVDCNPWGREESDTTERLHFHFPLSCIGAGNGNPLQCSSLENPRDGGAWWAAVYGVAQSRTRLKWLSSRPMPLTPGAALSSILFIWSASFFMTICHFIQSLGVHQPWLILAASPLFLSPSQPPPFWRSDPHLGIAPQSFTS